MYLYKWTTPKHQNDTCNEGVRRGWWPGFEIWWHLRTGGEQQGSAWMVVAMGVLGEDGGLSFLRK